MFRRLVIGLEPTQALGRLGDWEFVASLPAKVGWSLDGYYEQPDGEGDDAFGYASIGVAFAAVVPVGDGWPSPWRLEASLVHVTLDDGNRDRNGGHRNELVGTIGISASF